jgi:hypothetical protein
MKRELPSFRHVSFKGSHLVTKENVMLFCDECGSRAVEMTGPVQVGTEVRCCDCGIVLGTYPVFLGGIAARLADASGSAAQVHPGVFVTDRVRSDDDATLP